MEEFHKICDKFTNKELFQTDQNGKLVKEKDGNLTLKNEITEKTICSDYLVPTRRMCS